MNHISNDDDKRTPARKAKDKKTTPARKEDRKSSPARRHNAKAKVKPEEERRKAPTGKHAAKGPVKPENDKRPGPARKRHAETNERFEQDSTRKLNEMLLEESNRANAVRNTNTNTNTKEEGDDRTKLAWVSNSPPRRKNQQPYSQQLRTNTAPHSASKHQHELRKHSLDENRGSHCNGNNRPDSSDEDSFCSYSTVTGGGVGSVNDHHVDHQRIDVDGGGGSDDPSQPLMEFTGNGGSVGIFKAPSRAPVNPNRPPCIDLRPHPLRETQRENREGKMATVVDCYMKDKGVAKEDAIREFVELVENGWEDVTAEWVKKGSSSVPKELVELLLNYGRIAEITYNNKEDGYTDPEKYVGPLIAALYVDPIPLNI